MPEQIIYHGHMPQRVWDALKQRSRETRRKIDLQCPECNAAIPHTDTTHLRCLSCDVPVEIYQHSELTETEDRRIIYAEANAQHRALLTLVMQCLSCERTLQADETCTNTCGIQTYLVLDFQDGELYITRAANLPHVQRDTPFIPIRNVPDTDTHTPDTENSVQNSVENSLQSTDISDADPPNQPLTRENERPWRSDALTLPEKIVEFLTYINEDHTATGTQIKDALGGLAPSTFKWAMDQLIDAGKALKVAYNLYRLRTQRNQ